MSVSVTFKLKFVQIIYSSLKVAEWPTFGKELLTRLTISSLCILTICNFCYFPFLVLKPRFGFWLPKFLVSAYSLFCF